MDRGCEIGTIATYMTTAKKLEQLLAEADPKIQDFIKRTYQMIEECDVTIASWSNDGRSIDIKDEERFVTIELKKFFVHGNMKSFVRQLHAYGFKKTKCASLRIDNPNDIKARYEHKNFQRGRLDLLVLLHPPPKKQPHQPLKTTESTEPMDGKLHLAPKFGDKIADLEQKLSTMMDTMNDMQKKIHDLEERNVKLSKSVERVTKQNQMLNATMQHEWQEYEEALHKLFMEQPRYVVLKKKNQDSDATGKKRKNLDDGHLTLKKCVVRKVDNMEPHSSSAGRRSLYFYNKRTEAKSMSFGKSGVDRDFSHFGTFRNANATDCEATTPVPLFVTEQKNSKYENTSLLPMQSAEESSVPNDETMGDPDSSFLTSKETDERDCFPHEVNEMNACQDADFDHVVDTSPPCLKHTDSLGTLSVDSAMYEALRNEVFCEQPSLFEGCE